MNYFVFIRKSFPTLVLVCMFFLNAYSQSDDNPAEISLNFIAGRTPSLEIERDYEILGIGQRDITSDASSIFAVRLNYSRKISSKFAWDIGLEGGLNSYHFRTLFDENFVDLSLDQPFSTQQTGYDLPYAAGVFGLKYISSLTSRSRVTFKFGIRASYYIPIVTDFVIRSVLQSGQNADIFTAQIINNDNDRIILSPDLSLDYLLNFPQSPFSLISGFNTSFSRKNFMNGTYELNGDQEKLEGRFSKKMIFLNFGLGLIYRLD